MEKTVSQCSDTLKIRDKIKEIDKVISNYKETGFSLFTSTLLHFKDKSFLEKKLKRLNKTLNRQNLPTFCSGIVGIGWFYQYLLDDSLIDKADINDFLVQIDDIAFHAALSNLKKDNHDFLHGAVGNAVYLIERVNLNNKVLSYLLGIITQLLEMSKVNAKGRYWIESPFYLVEHKNGNEIVNLSLSHGLASKIVLFSKLLKLGIEETLTKQIIKECVEYMLNNKNPKSSISIFRPRIDDAKSDFSRLAWCYGDLGMCMALWQAGEALQDNAIKQEAIEIGLHTTKRKTEKDTGIVDAGICHGTTGAAHIYNRLYGYTGKEEFKIAADYWINQTLKMATFKDGLAGYKAYYTEKYGGWVNDYSFLEGIAGIGLVLDAYLNHTEPTWDKCLLLS